MRTLSLVVLLFLAAVPVCATEIDDAAADIVGAWQLDFTTPENEHRTPIVLVGRQQQELVAWYVEDETREEFESVRLEDDALNLTIRPKEYQGQLKVTLTAKLKQEGVCYGEASYDHSDGDAGSFAFTGKRLTGSDFDKATRWKLSFTTPDEMHHDAVVTVVTDGGQQYGWYSGREYELPLNEVSDRDGRLVMSVTAKTHDGAQVDVTFRGKIEGQSVEGDVDYEVAGETGSFPFSGKVES